jgi:hypothetical protein
MATIPFITSDGQLFESIRKLITTNGKEYDDLVGLDSIEKSVEYLNIEMPDLFLVDFSDDAIDAFALLDIIMKDPWLLHGGLIALCNNYEISSRLEKVCGANIVVILSEEEIENQLPRVMDIIRNNRRILFQRQLGSDIIGNIFGSFKLENNPVEAHCYANLICNFLYNANRLDLEKKDLLRFSLYEMLINAIEHGNCGITYDEKTKYLEEGGFIENLITQRCRDRSIADKRVTFEYTITPSCAKFLIADEGEGFDWREIKNAEDGEVSLALHGRGILVTKRLVQNFSFNEKGNEVNFEVGYTTRAANVTPRLFTDMEQVEINQGDTVFNEGEPSNFLYYIAKGEYDVIVGETIISTLCADDIFMGEMSFLLNNKRSATVKASMPGTLIRISKKDFVEAIKQYPHYALFLSRLLAQRIRRSNIMKATSISK